MKRDSQDSQAQAVLPPGFWSQAPSDQLHRLEQLLQQFLTLPGFQQGTPGAFSQPGNPPLPSPSQPPVATHQPISNSPSQPASTSGTGWAPSGSTWGPLAEAWKHVQQEKQSFAPRMDSPPARPGVPATAAPQPSQELPGNIAWHFPVENAEPDTPIPAWNLEIPGEITPWGGAAPDHPPALPSLESSNTFNHTPAAKTPQPGEQKASIPVQVGRIHKTLVFGNRVVDACLQRMGWPGRGLQSSLGKWSLGLTGICLLTFGTWLYFREAVDELVGQIGFSEMTPP